MKTIPFTKMHGIGNDYIYVNTMLDEVPNPSEAAIRWSDGVIATRVLDPMGLCL